MNAEVFRSLVFSACAEDPALVSQVIEAAAAGVKEFAQKQSDASSKMAFMMTQMLDQFPDCKQFGPFSRADILERISPWFKGTPWFDKQVALTKAA